MVTVMTPFSSSHPVLPQGTRLYMRTDSEKGTVIICAKDPADRPEENKWYFEEMAEILAEENWAEYSNPVPEALMHCKML